VDAASGQAREFDAGGIIEVPQHELRGADLEVEQGPVRVRHVPSLLVGGAAAGVGFRSVVSMVGRVSQRVRFTREELAGFEGAEVPDLIGSDVRLLVVGINPGLWTAATGMHFAHPGNRFWPALHRAGIVECEVTRGAPMSSDVHDHVIGRGLAITNLVARATARAAELGADELRAGADRLRRLVAEKEPRVVAVAGITAYRTAFGERSAEQGRQPGGLGGAELWVVPNPSGLNAHETIDSLAAAYREPAVRAGIVTA